MSILCVKLSTLNERGGATTADAHRGPRKANALSRGTWYEGIDSKPNAASSVIGIAPSPASDANLPRAILQKGVWTKVSRHQRRQRSRVRRSTGMSFSIWAARGCETPCRIAETKRKTAAK